MNLNILDMIEDDKKQEFDNASEVRLVKLEIENYRGIEKDTIEMNGKDVVFSGESGVGKTSRIEALLWLISNRIFDGSTSQLHKIIMPSNSDKETKLSVQATFEVGEEEYIFTKQMSEKWVKKQGSDEVVYEGVNVTYYVNGSAKPTVKAFNGSLQTLLGLDEAVERINKETKLLSKVDLIMLLSVLDFFPSLDNKTLRELVLLVGGNVDVKDLEMDETLRQALQKKDYDIDELKSLVKLKLKGDRNNKGFYKEKDELETELKIYQEKVSEAPKGKDPKELDKEIDEKVEELSKIKMKLTKGDSDIISKYHDELKNLELEKREKISQLKNDLTNNTEISELKEKRNDLKTQFDEIKEKTNTVKNKMGEITQTIKYKNGEIEHYTTQGKALVETVKMLKSKSTHDITCPKCEHTFEYKDDTFTSNIESETKKAKDLKVKVDQSKEGIVDLQEELEGLTEFLETLEKDGVEVEEELKALDDKITTLNENNVEALENVLNHKDVLELMSQIQRAKSDKNEKLLDFKIKVKKLEAKYENAKIERDELYQQKYKLEGLKEAQQKVEEISKDLKTRQNLINQFEKLQIDLKTLEEKYLLKLDENIKQSFGENIKFKMFETNMSNENLVPICEMYVKDQRGRWLPAVNGINTGHSVPRLVEFLVRVRKALNIKNGFLLIDFFESIGNEPLKELKAMGQQILATQVVRGQDTLEVELL